MAAGVTFRFARPEGFGNPFGGQDCANRDTGRGARWSCYVSTNLTGWLRLSRRWCCWAPHSSNSTFSKER